MSSSYRVAALVLRRASARSSLHPVSFTHSLNVKQSGLVYGCVRTYATPGRPKKAVGEASKPVRRTAKKATTSSSTKSKTAATKGGAKRKKTTAKAKPKAKPKKVLTEEEAARKKERAAKREITELKKTALQPPKKTRINAWSAYVKENVPKGTPLVEVRTLMTRLSDDFKQLSPADREHLNQVARQTNESSAAELKQWVQSHTVEEINTANRARRSLRRKIPNLKQTQYRKIDDERAVKRPLSPYVQFFKERTLSGDFGGISVPERTKLIGQEWKGLSAGDKQRYTDLANEAQNRFQQENGGAYQQQAAAGAA